MIAFDLDGTLVDSAPEIVASMEHAWRAVAIDDPFPRDRFRIGPPLLDILAQLSPSLDRARVEALAEAFRARYDASDFSATRPYLGIVELLDTLLARGERIAVATNKRQRPTHAILERWFPGRFALVATIDGVWPDDGTRPGSKTAMLEWLRTFRPASPRPLVMIGDTTADLAAARAARARAIAVTWGYDDAATLAAAKPDALVHDVESLLVSLA